MLLSLFIKTVSLKVLDSSKADIPKCMDFPSLELFSDGGAEQGSSKLYNFTWELLAWSTHVGVPRTLGVQCMMWALSSG